MRLLVHDYSGHPFQVQLSRELARRGHTVLHVYSASFHTPKGPLSPRSDDPAGFAVRGLELDVPFEKHTLIRRRMQEVAYGRMVAREARAFRPDVVLSSNTPPDAQKHLLRATRALGARFVFWVQDLYGVAAERILGRRLGLLGRLAGAHYRRIEEKLLADSDGIVFITDDFASAVRNGAGKRAVVIPNWAPLDDVPLRPKRNPWSEAHGLADRICVLYTGTIGHKHNPSLLLELARQTEALGAEVVVVSEGPAAEWLGETAAREAVRNLRLLPFQPFEQMANVLGSADLLVALLEPDAGAFSVPSKVLTYLCAGRPLLLAVPAENLAARIVTESGAGIVAPPSDTAAFVAAGRTLLEQSDERIERGRRAREYAERNFTIATIGDRFEAVITAQR